MISLNSLKNIFLFSALAAIPHLGMTQNFIKEGIWRGAFQLPDKTEAPFDFEVFGTTAANAKIYLINAQERVSINHFKKTKDSLYVYLDQYDNELAFQIVEADSLNGVLRKQDGTGLVTKLTATNEDNFRFPLEGPKAHAHLDGKWLFNFNGGIEKGHQALGVFTQKNGIIHGTVMTAAGDLRYLDGVVKGDNFYISTFNGSEPILFQGKVENGNTMNGTMSSSIESSTFTCVKDNNAVLPDPYKLTSLKDGNKKLVFSLPNLEGKQVSLADDKFKNKVTIVSITSSENTNCADETAFLSQWFKHHKHLGLELVTISYERNTNPEHVQKVLNRVKKKYSIQHEQLIGGKNDKDAVLASIPSLNNFVAFPTLFLIDKNGNVSKIHTGFYGPATTNYHETFNKEFNDEINKLLKEESNATVKK